MPKELDSTLRFAQHWFKFSGQYFYSEAVTDIAELSYDPQPVSGTCFLHSSQIQVSELVVFALCFSRLP